ncbi:RAMP superfamily CRISPR-associated protein [Cellulosilyticum ruminicola]|uniref:RAMP superfamily CRISPR-associated protein n=1 Tax=Cellulosilyticum ruminicola TaxID=425254 RepID=UPI0006D07D91|nr:RAMP superfamily CRISPR-associated protein [Cellulosilyticum ruminicola]
MQEVVLKVCIKTLSPINISSGNESRTTMTNFTIRNHQNKSFIPGTTIKGKLKHNFKLLQENEEADKCQEQINRLFGKEGFAPGSIYIDNFYAEEEHGIEIRQCNRIDRRRGVCVDGALFSKEVVSGRYKGEIIAYVKDEQEKEDIIDALQLITQIGSGKSKGLGQVEVKVEMEKL